MPDDAPVMTATRPPVFSAWIHRISGRLVTGSPASYDFRLAPRVHPPDARRKSSDLPPGTESPPIFGGSRLSPHHHVFLRVEVIGLGSLSHRSPGSERPCQRGTHRAPQPGPPETAVTIPNVPLPIRMAAMPAARNLVDLQENVSVRETSEDSLRLIGTHRRAPCWGTRVRKLRGRWDLPPQILRFCGCSQVSLSFPPDHRSLLPRTSDREPEGLPNPPPGRIR
jgi:hypothetical protein